MISELSEVMGWDRKHTIKALNGKVSQGKKAKKRGSKARCSEEEKRIIVGIWKASEQPCGLRLKATLPLWMESYEAHHGSIEKEVKQRVMSCSARTLERITLVHRMSLGDGKSRGGAEQGERATGSRSSFPFGAVRRPLTGLAGWKPTRFPMGEEVAVETFSGA